METELKDRLNNDEYKNWLKVTFALIQSKEALHDFTKDVIEKVHRDILTKTGASRCDGTCKTNKGKTPSCASCSKWVTEIKAYNKGLLNWKNTEPTIWHETPWEIAKCFMNPQGSKTTAAKNTGPEKTDLSGILNVLVNCKEFGRSYLKEKKQAEMVREIRNKVMHCPTMTFPEKDMKSFIDSIIALLEDELSLKNLEVCKKKVELIQSLRDGTFQIRPETEFDCIEGSLRTHELLLESGDEVNPETRKSLDNFANWIKHNKDLESRFDLKLNNISGHLKNVTDHFNTRMSTFEFSNGELKGKIECMESRMRELEKNRGVVAATSGFIQHDKSLIKSSLQCYVQKKKLGLPEYFNEITETHKFFSKVSVAGKLFSSEGAKSTKKEAEQSAAEVALKCFINESTDDYKENDFSSSPSNPPVMKNPIVLPKVQTENKKSYKNQLQEHAQEQKILNPHYETNRTKSDHFLSKVFFNGVWYSPDTLPQGRKIDAEQKAAEFVLAYLESNGTSLPQPDNGSSSSCTETSTSMAKETSPKSTEKTYKSILYEHVQKISSTCTPIDYEIEKCEEKFLCSVKVSQSGMTYKSPQAMNSIKEAKESAAMEACSQLKLLKDRTCQSDYFSSLNPNSADTSSSSTTTSSSSTTSSTTTTITKDVCCKSSATNVPADVDTSESCTKLSEVCASSSGVVDSPDGKKTFQSKLHEYVQQLDKNEHLVYEDIECESGFQMKVHVKLMGKTYESQTPQPTKKAAKEMAAREAWMDITRSTLSSERLSSNVSNGTSMLPSPNNDSSSKFSSAVAAPVASNFKGLLAEHVKQSKIEPNYITQQAPGTKEFFSKVYLGKRCFKSEKAKRKRDAEQNAAKDALEELKGCNCKSTEHCQTKLEEYQKKLNVNAEFPKYEEATCTDGEKFSFVVHVVKEWNISLGQQEPQPKKKDVEEALAKQALKLLEEEKQPISLKVSTNSKSKLNMFCQRQTNVPPLKYSIDGGEACFYGSLCFYTMEEYESLSPQPSKDKAIERAAMSACNDLCLI